MLKSIAKWLIVAPLAYSLTFVGAGAAFAVLPGPVITHGPYLTGMTDTSVTITWFTDLDSTGTVEYGTGGSFGSSVEAADKGMYDVGKQHVVHLTGLSPGTAYNYRVKSVEVEDLKAYSPVIGETVTSSSSSFTTMNTGKSSFSFYYMTDIKEDMTRYSTLLNLINTSQADFVAITGDQFKSVESESQVFTQLIDPAVNKFAKSLPLVYARGNVDMRGHYRAHLKDDLSVPDGKLYYGFRQGAAAFAVLDTGEDKADSNSEYGGLLANEAYMGAEYSWLQNYVGQSAFTSAPFRIFLQHQPNFGYNNETQWNALANSAGVKLVLAGNNLTYSHVLPGTSGNNYDKLILGQDQLAKITVTSTQIAVTVYDNTGAVVDTFTVA